MGKPALGLSDEVKALIKSCLSITTGDRSTLSGISSHPWMMKDQERPSLLRTVSTPMDVIPQQQEQKQQQSLMMAGSSIGISPAEGSSLMSMSPISVQIQEEASRLADTTHSEPEDYLVEEPMSISLDSHSPQFKQRLELLDSVAASPVAVSST